MFSAPGLEEGIVKDQVGAHLAIGQHHVLPSLGRLGQDPIVRRGPILPVPGAGGTPMHCLELGPAGVTNLDDPSGAYTEEGAFKDELIAIAEARAAGTPPEGAVWLVSDDPSSLERGGRWGGRRSAVLKHGGARVYCATGAIHQAADREESQGRHEHLPPGTVYSPAGRASQL